MLLPWVRNENMFSQITLEKDILEKFTKLTKVGFSIACITAEFLQFSAIFLQFFAQLWKFVFRVTG